MVDRPSWLKAAELLVGAGADFNAVDRAGDSVSRLAAKQLAPAHVPSFTDFMSTLQHTCKVNFCDSLMDTLTASADVTVQQPELLFNSISLAEAEALAKHCALPITRAVCEEIAQIHCWALRELVRRVVVAAGAGATVTRDMALLHCHETDILTNW